MLNDPINNAIAQQKQQQQAEEQLQLTQLQMQQQQQQQQIQQPCADQFSICPNIRKRANLIAMQDYSLV
jgi:hypothetical protein